MDLLDTVRSAFAGQDPFFVILARQASVARRAAHALAELGGGRTIADVQAELQRLEREGDVLVHELEEALQKTLMTPISREDLQRLSAELDEVVDLTSGVARTCALLEGTEVSPAMTELVALLLGASARLDAALPLLGRHELVGLVAESRAIRRLERDARRVLDAALSQLFHDSRIEPKKLIRDKEVLDQLGRAIERCGHVAHTLMHLAVKNG